MMQLAINASGARAVPTIAHDTGVAVSATWGGGFDSRVLWVDQSSRPWLEITFDPADGAIHRCVIHRFPASTRTGTDAKSSRRDSAVRVHLERGAQVDATGELVPRRELVVADPDSIATPTGVELWIGPRSEADVQLIQNGPIGFFMDEDSSLLGVRADWEAVAPQFAPERRPPSTLA
ncbi:MAG: hypothetical protein ACF8NJ_02005 [Phycisphaerales bacterium JB038]